MSRSAMPRRWSIRLGMIAVVGVVLYASRQTTLSGIGQLLDVGQQPQSADYVMLLNGDRNTRPFCVAELVRTGIADRAIITSTRIPTDRKLLLQPQTHEVTRAILNRCGVGDDQIEFIDARCDNTFDEAATLGEFMETRPEASFLVVTNTYHSRRSRWVLDHVLGPKMKQVRMVSAPTDFYNAHNWWKHEEGFVAYLAEFFKAGFYFVRYGTGIIWIAGVAGLIGLGWWFRRTPNPAPVA